jgi:hypothetical protein
MKTALRILLVFIVALISVAASETAMITWLEVTPWDVTGNLFWLGILPTQVIVIGLATLTLSALYRRNRKVYATLFIAVHVALYTTMLSALANPWPDIATYWIAIFCANAIWLTIALRSQPPIPAVPDDGPTTP